jgi:Flp pilus assembly protein TadG
MLSRRNARAEAGAIAVIVAILSVVLFGVAALVVDIGMALESRRDAQKAADLAALAGGQELPSQTKARAMVAQYLTDNGWGLPPGNPQVILNDDDYSNGEVDFGNGLAGTGRPNTSLTVYPPEEHVGFLVAGVFNTLSGPKAPTGVDVSAAATVEIRSVKNILPFQVPAAAAPGIQCIKNNNANPCDDQSGGSFGLLDFPRTDVTGADATIESNIREGVQFTPTVIPDADALASRALAGETIRCTAMNTPPGAILVDYADPVDGFNCIAPGPGNKTSIITDALIGKLGCNGRLAVASGTPGAPIVNGCSISPDKFLTYASPGATIADVSTWGPIDPTISQDPRFGILPVVASKTLVDTSGSAKQVPIVRFYGSYYRTFYDSNGDAVPPSTKTNINAVSSYVFPLDLIEGVLPNDAGTIPYIGGAKVPVLVK